MDDADLGFCTRCGRRLRGGETRCPECGAWLDSGASRAELARVQAAYRRQLRIASAIMLACSTVVLAFGIASRLWPDGLADALVGLDVPAWALGGDRDAGETADHLRSSSLPLIVSGFCGLGAGVLTAVRRRYWIAMVLCSVSIIAGPSGVAWLFLEFLAFWMTMSARYGFEEYGSGVRGRL